MLKCLCTYGRYFQRLLNLRQPYRWSLCHALRMEVCAVSCQHEDTSTLRERAVFSQTLSIRKSLLKMVASILLKSSIACSWM